MIRWVPPAHSPLDAGDVVAGAAALLGGSGGEPAADFLADLGGRGAMLTDSGTSALTLAIRGALALRPGGGVALPAFCCFDVATAADGADAPVLLYDVDPATLGPDAASLRGALDAGAAAVVVAHLFGVPVDMPAILALARGAGAVVIEDAAQAAGGRLAGRPLGAFGSVSVLSFGRGKGVTGGGGGALVALDLAGTSILDRAGAGPLARRGGALAWMRLAAQWALGRPALYGIPASLPFLGLGETVYRAPRPAAGISRVAAGVVERTWRAREAKATLRRTIAERLLRERPASLEPVVPPFGALPGYLRLPLVATAASRTAAASPRARRLGVMPSYPTCLADLPGFAARCRNAAEPLPGARTLAARLITLPTHGLLTEADVERLLSWMREAG